MVKINCEYPELYLTSLVDWEDKVTDEYPDMIDGEINVPIHNISYIGVTENLKELNWENLTHITRLSINRVIPPDYIIPDYIKRNIKTLTLNFDANVDMTGFTSISRLNLRNFNNVLLKIPDDICSLVTTLDMGRHVSLEKFANLRKLIIDFNPGTSFQIPQNVLNNIEFLVLPGEMYIEEAINLIYLNTSNPNVSPQVASQLNGLSINNFEKEIDFSPFINLERLSMSFNTFNKSNYNLDLSSFSKLKELELYCWRQERFIAINNCPSIRKLTLRNAVVDENLLKQVRDLEIIGPLKDITNLNCATHVKILRCENLKNVPSNISSTVEELHLGNVPTTQELIRFINLKKLIIDHYKFGAVFDQELNITQELDYLKIPARSMIKWDIQPKILLQRVSFDNYLKLEFPTRIKSGRK